MENFENILFIDIETVSQADSLNNLDPRMKHIWEKKYTNDKNLQNYSIEEAYQNKAAIYAEFGKIICISVAIYDKTKNEFRMRSFFSDTEKSLLEEFANFCIQTKKKFIFCGHNIREFDIPYISRRCLINGIPIPKTIDFQTKKPWEVDIIDTIQMWKFGDYKNFTSLETLTTIFDIPTSKNDIDGSQVGGVYWKEKNLPRIVEYCQNDVIALIQLLCRFQQKPLIPLENIKFIQL